MKTAPLKSARAKDPEYLVLGSLLLYQGFFVQFQMIHVLFWMLKTELFQHLITADRSNLTFPLFVKYNVCLSFVMSYNGKS